MTIREPETFDDLKSFSINDLSKLKLSSNMIKLREAVLADKVNIS